MSFNKAREENKWRQWKEAEEKKMRELGVQEYVISELHRYDWMIFKQERVYKSRQIPDTDKVNTNVISDDNLKIKQPLTMQEFVEAIDDSEIRSYLEELDTLTMRIILLKTLGYSTREISVILGITRHVIYQRMKRLRKKFKKFLL